jgi:hypothetical protein
MKTQLKPKESYVLAVALENLKDILAISFEDLGKIIRIHRNTLREWFYNKHIDPQSAEGELSLLLIKVYRSLYALNGGNIDAIKHWLHTDNRHLKGCPFEIMKTVLGLSRVVIYLDAIRGKI